MTLGRYRLLAQLGAGSNGAVYRAEETGADGSVVVCLLGGARGDETRWRALSRRLRLAAMLDHPAAVGVRALDLEHDPPYVALEEAPADDLGTAFGRQVPLAAEAVAGLGRELVAALAAAHHLGLAHGSLGPGAVRLSAARAPKIDFTGIDVSGPANDHSPSELETSCRAPELSAGRAPDAAADVYALGALLFWLLYGRPFQAEAPAPSGNGTPLLKFLRLLLAADPVERPSAPEALTRLDALLGQVGRTAHYSVGATVAAPALVSHSGPPRERLGHYRLLEKLGEGGLGQVFKAEDLADGTVVAVKVLHPELAGRPDALRRFRKEARLLAEVRNPYVANLIEVNEDAGVHFLALEFVAGTSLGRLLAEHGRLAEARALGIAADVARALADAHRRGIVHRDVKPDNILLEGNSEDGRGPDPALLPRVKLADFGLARHVVESASLNLTREGATVGTALYMAPEQAAGEGVGPTADVYALGATLFHMLAGRPPFEAESALALSLLHANQAPPALERLDPAPSSGACQVVARALAKRPGDRYPDAGGLLRDLERLLRGEPTGIAVHPRLPACAPRRLRTFDWTWDLEAPPELLWPYVCNTDRLNRAVGIPAVEFSAEPAEPPGPGLRTGVRRFGRFRKAGFTNAWQEHPFEWVEGRRLGVLREYSQGVFKWLASMTELTPRAGGGTTLAHRVRIEPRNWIGNLVAAVEIGLRGRRQVEQVYRRIDAFVTGRLVGGAADPFEVPPPLSAARRRRLEGLLERLVACGVEPAVALRLGEFLGGGAPQAVARIRPLALARRLGLDSDAVVAACLHGAREGLLVLLWDILCPICRLPASITDTLRALGEHGHCVACNLDFALDFSNAVELIFRAHPQVRDTELRTYCVGGPFHWPHVPAQVRVQPGERVEIDLQLGEGAYRLGGPQLPYAFDFRVEEGAFLTRWDFDLRPGGGRPAEPPRLRAGGQLLAVSNGCDGELLLRVERAVARDDALTAARASSLALFRELFPGEVLSPGQLVSVAAVTLLVTDLGRPATWTSRETCTSPSATPEPSACCTSTSARPASASVARAGPW